MISIADFAQPIAPVEALVRGKAVEVHALTLADRALAVQAAGDVPVPPVKPNPNKGSLAAPEPDRNDPEYQVKMVAWGDRLMLADIAIAVRWVPQQESAAPRQVEGVRKAMEEIKLTLTEYEVSVLHEKINRAEKGGGARDGGDGGDVDKVGAALKN